MSGATRRDASSGRPGRRVLRVAWNLRMLGLFLIGPGAGVLLGGAIFGLPTDICWLALATFGLSLALFGTLARAEWRRLSHDSHPPPPPRRR